MSDTSSRDIRSLTLTRPRSWGSVSGSGVDARSFAHSARVKAANRENVFVLSMTPSDVTTRTPALTRAQTHEHRQRHRKSDDDDDAADDGTANAARGTGPRYAPD